MPRNFLEISFWTKENLEDSGKGQKMKEEPTRHQGSPRGVGTPWWLVGLMFTCLT